MWEHPLVSPAGREEEPHRGPGKSSGSDMAGRILAAYTRKF